MVAMIIFIAWSSGLMIGFSVALDDGGKFSWATPMFAILGTMFGLAALIATVVLMRGAP